MKEKFTFLILHYLTIKDTQECVESILNTINYNNYDIVIVDNGSPNNTGEKLLELYKNNSKIKVLINKTNLGFAKGNNIGFKYIKENLGSDFIIMINNDIIMEDKNFVGKIVQEYKRDPFHILGPKIISLVDKKNQNPMPVLFEDSKGLKRQILKVRILLLLNYFHLDNYLMKIKNTIFQKEKYNFNDFEELPSKYMLHGSCLIFSKDYINRYNGLYNKTFMYREEDILYFIAKRDNLIMRYFENTYVFHKEDSATNAFLKKDQKKRRFSYKHTINSYRELYKLMLKSNIKGVSK